jgi:transcriptional regulator with XRE-family HTH domain
MAKQYSSVLGLVKDTSDDKDFDKSFEELINSKQIAKTLFSLRCRSNQSQEDVANKMGCTQGKVSKIENSKDVDLSISDLVKYCSAVNMRLEIGFSDLRMTMVDQVKYHYFKLKSLLDKMREVATGDESMEKGVANFTKEAFVNISFGLLSCVHKFTQKKESQLSLHVSNPVNIEDLAQQSIQENQCIPT